MDGAQITVITDMFMLFYYTEPGLARGSHVTGG